MIAVGIRELKDRLSEFLRRVAAGEEILVTDRGKVVAEIRRPGKAIFESPHPRLLLHAQAGKARIGATNEADLYPRLSPALRRGTSREILEEERGER
jgi:antitoxin (DNA-binding transcriptional repressor) of toxin-antitoxin stability system